LNMYWIKDIWKNSGELASGQKKQRQFGGMILGILGLVLFIRLWNENEITYGLLGCTIAMLLITILIPSVLKATLQIWFVLGSILGEITSTLILGVIYFLLFVPINLFRRNKIKSGWQKVDDTDRDFEKLY
jgi:hypothetical protein